MLSVYGLAFGRLVQAPDGLASLGRSLTALTDGRARVAWWDDAVERARTAYGIERSLVEAIGDRPTTVDPWHVSALLPTRATWDPLPVFQLYAAYTPALDALDADSITVRPRQILRATPPDRSDQRFAYWEAPRYQTAVYCRYRLVHETNVWQLLRPRPTDRCGAPEYVRAVDVAAGSAIAVPSRVGAITVASIAFRRSPLEVVADLVFKGPERHVTYGTDTWRMQYVPEAHGLMLNVPVPDAAFPGLPARPFPTLTLDAPARVEFSYVDVSRDRPDGSGTGVSQTAAQGPFVTDAAIRARE